MPWILALLLYCCAVSAQAGAWPRAQGSFFIAVSDDQTRSQIYAEYGLKGDWTLGVEVTMPRGRRLPDVTQFVHRPVWDGAAGGILSVGLAIDLRETTAAWANPLLKGVSESAVRGALMWGKGFETRFGDGWATVDAQVEKLVSTDWLGEGMAYKLDIGLGLKPIDRLMLMAQAQYWRRGINQTLRVETSAAWAFGPTKVVLSPSVGVIGPKDPRLKLGLWLEY
jgi:hypothetical protein